MVYGRAILAAILAGVITGCGANGALHPNIDGTPSHVADDATAAPTSTPITTNARTGSQSSFGTPAATHPATPARVAVPPKPRGVTFDSHAVERDETGHYADITQTVTWSTPRNDGVEIRVYGVTKCIAEPREPAPDTSGPCLVTGTPLPESVRTLLGRGPASDGAVSWSWTEETGCDVGLGYDPDGPAYHAVVLAAYNPSGHSIFAIAEPGLWWQPGPNDTVC